MKYQVHKIQYADEFKTCPLCQYKDGFHSMLRREGDEIRLFFICPSCQEVFDTGHKLKQ